MKKAALATLGALLLVVSACGGTDSPSSTRDGKQVVRALTRALTDTSQGVAAKDAACIATKLVDDLDVKPLVSAKIVTKSFAFVDGSLDQASGKARAGYDKARAACLQAKIAASMVGVISAEGGLLTRKSAACVAKDFTGSAGLDKLIAGRAVTTQLAYVSDGALQTPENAAAYAEALGTCVGEKKVTSTLSKAVETAFETGGDVPATGNVSCLVDAFVKKVGVKGLLTNRLVSDTGVFNNAGARYDTASATALADSILGCVDALKSQAQTAASADKSLDVAALEACLKKAISTDYLREEFLVNQLLGEDAKAQAASAVIQARSQGCVAQQH
jgi:hypothetical protein